MATTPRTIYLVKMVEVAVRAGLEQRLQEFQLTGAQYTVLSLLSTRDNLSSADLSRRFLVTPQSMNEMIMALERKELVSRQEDEENRRILRVKLTLHGQAVLKKCDRQVDELEAALFGGLDPSDLARLRDALSTVVASHRGMTAATKP
ncbi:MAG: Transcriptional regulator, MarR family [Rhodospirillales bacterium]|jgi:DNA-binding MarR family transcriptional regulator|nr:Transcriptional regulator, MarR family [Rhodospirillales bacterium]